MVPLHYDNMLSTYNRKNIFTAEKKKTIFFSEEKL